MYKLVKGNSSAELVREMLCNMFYRPLSWDNRALYVRRQVIEFSPLSVRTAYGLEPMTEPCAFFQAIERPTIADEVTAFCFEGNMNNAQWDKTLGADVRCWRVAKKHVCRMARWFVEWVENWIAGQTVNPVFDFEMCTMAYCLAQGQRINIPGLTVRYVWNRMEGHNKKGPGHNYLFLKLAEDAGIRLTEAEKTLEPDVPRTWAALLPPQPFPAMPPPREFTETEVPAGGPPGPSQTQARPDVAGPSQAPHLETEMQRLERLMLSGFRQLDANRARDMDYFQESMARMGQVVSAHGQWVGQVVHHLGFEPTPPYTTEGYIPPPYERRDWQDPQ